MPDPLELALMQTRLRPAVTGDMLDLATRVADLLGTREIALVGVDGDEPSFVREFFGTEQVEGRQMPDTESRLGNCYELAAAALHRTPAASRLVHGSIHGPDEEHERIAHAWVELPGGLLWEPITRGIYDADAWRRYSRAWDERTYTIPAAARLMVAAGHFGPWHEPRYP